MSASTHKAEGPRIPGRSHHCGLGDTGGGGGSGPPPDPGSTAAPPPRPGPHPPAHPFLMSKKEVFLTSRFLGKFKVKHCQQGAGRMVPFSVKDVAGSTDISLKSFLHFFFFLSIRGRGLPFPWRRPPAFCLPQTRLSTKPGCECPGST